MLVPVPMIFFLKSVDQVNAFPNGMEKWKLQVIPDYKFVVRMADKGIEN
jgi:hypothetical protein